MLHAATIESPIGHNNPPSDADLLRQQLEARQALLLANTERLLLSAERAPQACDSDETAAKITELVKLITTNAKALEGARVAEKEPHLTAERTVDNFFKTYQGKLDAAKKKITAPLNAWLQKKADDERRAREEEARRQQEKARLELEAALTMEKSGMSEFSESALAQAEITERNAQKLAASAAAKPAALAKVHSAAGTASLRTEWRGTIDSRDALDLEALRPHLTQDALQKALDAFVRAGGRELRGATIRQESSAVVR